MADPFDIARLRIARTTRSDGTIWVDLLYDGAPLASFADEQAFDKDEGSFSGLDDTVLRHRARLIAAARGISDSAVDPPISDYPPVERHVAPDRRTLLDLYTGYDPRDIHEQQDQKRPRVYDALTGRTVLDLVGVELGCRFAWEAGGALLLTMDNGIGIRLALADGVFATSADGWIQHPVEDARLSVRRLFDPPARPARARPAARNRWWLWPLVILAVMIAALAVFEEGRFPRGGRLVSLAPPQVDSWLLRCAGIALPVSLHRSGDMLQVPSQIAPAALGAAAADLYGDGTVVIAIHRTAVTILPTGPANKPLDCIGSGA